MPRRKDVLKGDILFIDYGEGVQKEYDLNRMAQFISLGEIEEGFIGITEHEKKMVSHLEMFEGMNAIGAIEAIFLMLWQQRSEESSFQYESESWNDETLDLWVMFCLSNAIQDRVNRLVDIS